MNVELKLLNNGIVRRETPTVTCEGCVFDDDDGPICQRPATVEDCSDWSGKQYIYVEAGS